MLGWAYCGASVDEVDLGGGDAVDADVGDVVYADDDEADDDNWWCKKAIVRGLGWAH